MKIDQVLSNKETLPDLYRNFSLIVRKFEGDLDSYILISETSSIILAGLQLYINIIVIHLVTIVNGTPFLNKKVSLIILIVLRFIKSY
jgi:hypothetical protein